MTEGIETGQASEVAAQVLEMATWSAIAGLVGSFLLAVPILKGLKGRRAFETALKDYRVCFANGQAPTKGDREEFEIAKDTFLVDALGSYQVNRVWAFWGMFFLATSFGLALW